MAGCFTILLFVAGVIYLAVRAARGTPVDVPSCAKCLYAVIGLPGNTCPECGSDLDVVGIIRPGDRKPLRRWEAAVVFTALYPLPALILTLFLVSLAPMVRSTAATARLGQPASGAYQAVVMRAPAGGGGTTEDVFDTGITVTTNDGVDHTAIIDENEELIFTIDGETIRQPWGMRAIIDWLSELGIDTDDPDVAIEIQEMVDIDPRREILGNAFTGPGTSSSSSTGSTHGFGSRNTSSAVAVYRYPHTTGWAIFGNLLVWSGVIAFIFARRREPSVSADPQS